MKPRRVNSEIISFLKENRLEHNFLEQTELNDMGSNLNDYYNIFCSGEFEISKQKKDDQDQEDNFDERQIEVEDIDLSNYPS